MSEKRSRSKENHKKSKEETTSFLVTNMGVRLLICGLLIFVFVLAGTSAYRFGYKIFASDAVEEEPGTDVIVTIQDGMSSSDIADLLANKGLINDTLVFVIQTKVYTNSSYYIQPGTYTLNTSMTPEEMIEAMADEPSEEEEETTALASGDEDETEESSEDSDAEDSGEDQTDE